MNKNKMSKKDYSTVAENNYHSTFETEKTNNKGLAKTHEQASDTWTEGTIEGEIDKTD